MKIASDTKKEEDKKADKQIQRGQEPKSEGNPTSSTGLNKVVNDKQKE